jgi:hypothetical protein
MFMLNCLESRLQAESLFGRTPPEGGTPNSPLLCHGQAGGTGTSR